MTFIVDLPEKILEIENTWVPMEDGCRLAARIWMPENAKQNPVPAILEYLPYRKRDGTADRDEITHPYVAAQGYACVRVDMRGNGDSLGLMEDEYTKQEQNDALEVIEWLTQQPWCSGNVGMIGISWGGFNGLQVAARNPSALKAVISICSTDDRYADDIHYMGGCLLNYNLGWASTMLAYSSRSPDPILVGENWRKIWLDRLENMPFLIKPWLDHQHRDDYWKHGSICEAYSDIKAPVFLVGGWADGYTNTIFRMLQHLKSPVKALVGPWAHKYPHFAAPGPAMGFLQECVQWWDHWLKGKKTKTMDEPIRLYVQDSHEPRAMLKQVPGQWISKGQWPSPDVETRVLFPGITGPDTSLENTPGQGQAQIATPQTLGSRCGRWFSMCSGPDLPVDQKPDDQDALVFDTPILEKEITLCGAPVLKAQIASDQAHGILVARINDVRPDGGISRMSYGMLNLAHYLDHEHPRSLVPGKFVTVTLKLNDLAWRLKPGHKIRLALSNTYWPMIWPSATPVTLTMDLANTCLELPVLTRQTPAPPMDEPVCSPPLAQTVIRPASLGWRIEEDMETQTLVTRNLEDYGERIIDAHGLRTSLVGKETWSIQKNNPASAGGSLDYEVLTARKDWQTKTKIATRMKADEKNFYITATMTALEGEEQIFHKSWNYTIARDLV